MTAVPQPEDDRTQMIGNREFCVYGVIHRVNCAPVDDVCRMSLSASMRKTTEAGREGMAWLTASQAEETRMDEQNRILNNLLGGPIVVPFPPRGVSEPEILDCGFGNHAWIDGLLEDHEDWQVSIGDLDQHLLSRYCDRLS